jgi:putative nucleotidyltransferase with HDIG domain
MMIPGRTIMPYLFPAATVPMALATLISPGYGVMSALVLGALGGFLAPRGLEVALYVVLAGSMGALMIGKAERLSSFFWAGLAASMACVSVVVVFRFPDPGTDLLGKATLLGAGLLMGVLSASLAFALLLLVGNVLGITTTLQLLELARPDHPLLQLILRNAPGTYQHSLQVANLAEQAARAVGANALLTRVGALYHDAGKALRPQYFIENQVRGQNVHEQLDPATSAEVILDHVRDGLELARRYRLPPRVQAFISEHHGELETSYQYHEALEAAGGDAARVDHSHYEYPGPKPQSRETAILMLADGVEAKARAEAPHSEGDLGKLVRWVIDKRVEQGQLRHVDLTFRDLDIIRRSFVNTLKGMYHPRVVYPEEEGEESAQAKPSAEATPSSSVPLAPPEA